MTADQAGRFGAAEPALTRVAAVRLSGRRNTCQAALHTGSRGGSWRLAVAQRGSVSDHS